MVAPAAFVDFIGQFLTASSSIGESIDRQLEFQVKSFDEWISEASKHPKDAANSPPRTRASGASGDVGAANEFRNWRSSFDSRAAVNIFASNGRAVDVDGAAETPPKRARTGPAVDMSTSPLSPGSPLTLFSSPASKVGADKFFSSKAGASNEKGASACDRFGVRQGPLGAPSPCRAPRLGPIPLSPPPKEGPPVRAQGAVPDGVSATRSSLTFGSIGVGGNDGIDTRSSQSEQRGNGGGMRDGLSNNAALSTPCPVARTNHLNTPGSGLMAPVCFAQPSKHLEDVTPPATPPPASSQGWQNNALFAPPPPSPSPVKLPGEIAAVQLEGSESSRRLPATFLPEGALLNGHVDMAPSFAAALASRSLETPGQGPGSGTPMSVSERIRMYETQSSTPCLRQPSAGPTAQAANRLLATVTGATAPTGQASTPALGAMTVGGVCGSNTRGGVAGATASGIKNSSRPQPGTAASLVKPKELFRSQSEYMRPPQKVQPHSARGTLDAHRLGVTRLGYATNVHGASAGQLHGTSGAADPERNDVLSKSYERMAAGGRSGDVAKPKSLKAAEHAKQQEREAAERKQRERHEREQDRERERVKALAASASSHDLSSATASGQAAAAAKSGAAGGSHLNSSAKKGRRSAVLSGDAAAVGATSASAAVSSMPAQASTGNVSHSLGVAEPLRRPTEHALTEAAVRLRQKDLGAKRPEDNYEISEGADSDADEETISRDRSHKHVPQWCEAYLEELKAMADIDPDTIFAAKVPQCVLEEVFTDALYTQVGKNRPKRQRGSSGDWRRDRLTNTEVRHYKTRMGQIRCWDVERSAAPSTSSATR